MTAFAIEWLTGLYGADIGKAVGKTPCDAMERRSPSRSARSRRRRSGGQPSRRILMEPMRERVFFAGEAVHETLWGTVGGAWESGERAADAALQDVRDRLEPVPSAPAADSEAKQR